MKERDGAMLTLKGITWDHPRGYDPLAATAAAYRESHPDVRIVWETRSLQAFGNDSVEELAADHDLLVIDHPHVGNIARGGCLVALDQVGRDAALAALASQSLGRSHESYQYDGHQWALAIDAAAQVAARRPDLIESVPRTWDDAVALARTGKVLWPLQPIDAMMSFLTLTANVGAPCPADGNRLVSEHAGRTVLRAMRDLARLVPPACLTMNPIQALERLTEDDAYVYAPLLFAYANYARAGFRRCPIAFGDIPALGDDGPGGSVLGGAGIGVSAKARAVEVAVDYAFWVAGADCQRSLYARSGGQPAHVAAWEDPAVDADGTGFFRSVRPALDGAYVRPRYHGWLGLQSRGAAILHVFLSDGLDERQALTELEAAYQDSIRELGER